MIESKIVKKINYKLRALTKNVKQKIASSVYEPLYCKIYKRDNRLNYYKYYKQAQWNTLEKNKKIQAEKLYNLIKYATEYIPYYKKIKEENNISISKQNIFNDIKKFPILTKDIIRKEYDTIHKIKLGKDIYYNTSGGSTGEPIKLIQDNKYQAASSAMTRVQYEWASHYLGDSQIKLWGSVQDILGEKTHFSHRFANWMKSTYTLNAFALDDKMMHQYVNTINKKKPPFILAYVQSIYELAQFIEKNNLVIHSPKSIMTSAGTLNPVFRQKIETVFRCPVFNRYGSREVGNIAAECEKHEGLHLSMFTHYIEILNNNLKPCKEGETGEIYVTVLSNYTMPLIRYKIGDLAVHTNKLCSCKRGLPLIKDVVGRTNSIIRTSKGTFDSAAISALLFFYKDDIPFQSFSKYQLIQESKTKIILNVVVSDSNMWIKEKQKIQEKFRKVFGSDVNIIFREVNKILPLKSGKYSYIITKIQN